MPLPREEMRHEAARKDTMAPVLLVKAAEGGRSLDRQEPRLAQMS